MNYVIFAQQLKKGGITVGGKSNKVIDISEESPTAALSAEERQNRMIGYAIDMAEEQLRNRTASSQVVTHFLKLGTVQAQLELEKLASENALLKAKTEAIQSGKEIESLFTEAIKAMTEYRGDE